MGQCEYGKGEKKVEYYENYRLIPYECPRDSLPDKHHCEFHDSDYAQANPDDVMKSFYTLVDEAVQNTKPLFGIGFYLPMEVNLTKKEFKDRIYFSHATFTERANFSDATFTKEADFSDADFIDEVKFNKSRFPSPKTGKDSKDNTALIRFDYSKYSKWKRRRDGEMSKQNEKQQ